MKYKTGDIILVEAGLLSRLVIWFQNLLSRDKNDKITKGHSLLVRNETEAYEFDLDIYIVNIEEYLKTCSSYKIFRYKYLTYDKKESLIKIMDRMIGLKYGWKRFLSQILDQIFFTNRFTKNCKDKLIQVCSSVDAWIFYILLRYRFNNVDWYSCEPDDIDDHCSNSEDWILVEEK